MTANKGDSPNNFFPEVHTSNKGIHAGDRSSVLLHLPANDIAGASNGVQRPDSSASVSMPDQRIERLSDVSPEPARPLENFQRSKSRQRALELRSSAKSVKSTLLDENNAGVLAGVTTGSEIATLQHDHVRQLELVESIDISKESCGVEEAKLVEFHGKENGMVSKSVLCCQFCILTCLLPGVLIINLTYFSCFQITVPIYFFLLKARNVFFLNMLMKQYLGDCIFDSFQFIVCYPKHTA